MLNRSILQLFTSHWYANWCSRCQSLFDYRERVFDIGDVAGDFKETTETQFDISVDRD